MSEGSTYRAAGSPARVSRPERLPVSIAAGNPVTAEVGERVLLDGGSAADAAVAMVLTACVAETVFTGLGGGGFAVYYDAGAKTTTCLDFFVAVPGLAGRRAVTAQEISIDFGGQLVPYAVGPATVAVPGVPAGVAHMHARWGRLSWRDVLAPSIHHARRGVTLAPPHAKVLATVAPAMLIGEGLHAYAKDGAVLTGGGRVFHPGLDTALQILADDGADAFYTGPIGAATLAAVGELGHLGAADLEAYRVVESEPQSAALRDVEVLARGDDLDDLLGTLRRLEPGPDPGAMALNLVAALRAHPRRGDTTSVAVCDRDGNACAVTTSLGLSSGVWLPGYGIHLNSMLGEGELLRHDLPAGSRMSSMMSPLIALRDGVPGVVAGAAGGSRIRSALLQVLVNLVEHRMPVQAAVDAPRLNPVPDKVHVEPGFPPAVLDSLRQHDEVVEWPALDSYFGGVSAIDSGGPGADPRRGGDVRTLVTT
jgi:gamma-glutamyltranspeptidase / glutathione hydrolase